VASRTRGSRRPLLWSRREDFLGPGPWQIVRWGGEYRATPDPDPVYLYTEDVIGILTERQALILAQTYHRELVE
jgi:protein-L-isoaspartate(D-aspartate) O-methyltransferase